MKTVILLSTFPMVSRSQRKCMEADCSLKTDWIGVYSAGQSQWHVYNLHQDSLLLRMHNICCKTPLKPSLYLLFRTKADIIALIKY